MRKLFEMLNRLYQPVIIDKFKLDAKIGHKESINIVLKRVD